MRITNPTLLRGYTRDLNRVLELKNKSEHKITTQRKFSRASEAPLSAAKALNVRKSQYYSAQHQENLKVAAKFYTEAETSLIQVSEQMAIIRETIIAACNTTKDYQDLDIYAQQLETKAHELCAIFNTDSAGRAIFGGESDNSMPFEIINDSTGHAATVTYHNIPVNAMKDFSKFPYSDEVNLDIGLGMVIDKETHEADPDSVLRISFNGPEVAGCGAEHGVADIDLSSILKQRTYSLYVYAGDVKQEITFTGQDTADKNVQEIQAKLDEAFEKEIVYGRPRPEIDKQGVISLKDKMGDAVEGGVVSVINNPYPKDKHTSKLVVDNDSNYTDKFRLSLDKLLEGKTYRVDVQVGDGEKKTIEFEAGTDNLADPNNPIFREDVTVANFQKALDEAFKDVKVTISPNDPTKGIVSAEGKSVKLTNGLKPDEDPDAETESYGFVDIKPEKADVKSDTSLYLAKLEKGVDYVMKVTTADGRTEHITFEAGVDVTETKKNISDAFDKVYADKDKNPLGALKIANNGDFTYTPKGGESKPVKIEEVTDPAKLDGNKSIDLGQTTTYKIDLTDIEADKNYSLKVIVGDEIQNINFTGDGDAVTKIQTELDKLFGAGNVKIGTDGTVTSTAADKPPVSVSNNLIPNEGENKVFEREYAYSYNYIQLTLDAARALREGDIAYANGCIDRIVTANEKLLVEIADMGCNEEFIDFNLSRLTIRDENLAERQNDLETIDPQKEITLWKQYDAMYNACLQMSSSAIPPSIFDYMK